MTALRHKAWCIIAAALLACAGATAAMAQDKGAVAPNLMVQPKKPEIVDFRLITRWSVIYDDAALGRVQGTAFVDWTAEKKTFRDESGSGRLVQEIPGTIDAPGRARVVMRDPATDQEFQLVAHRIKVGGPNDQIVSMTLEGLSPSAPRVSPPDTTTLPHLATGDGQSVTLKLGDAEKSVPVSAKARAQAQRVDVVLRHDGSGVLSGVWSYDSDPLTRRDRDGQGRVGGFRLYNKEELEELNHPPAGADDPLGIDGRFLGVMMGWEQWWPMPTVIAGIGVVEDQLEFRDGSPRYAGPFPEQVAAGWSGGPTHQEYRWKTEEAQRRTLLVVGRNLPFDQGKALAEIEGGEGISSAVLIATSKDTDIPPEIAEQFKRGWSAIVTELNDKGLKVKREDVERGMEAALVRVKLGDAVVPGPKQFIWGGSRRAWLLQYGNNHVALRVVRPLPGSISQSGALTEESEEFFLPEQVAVEVESDLILPLDMIPVRVRVGSAQEAAKSQQSGSEEKDDGATPMMASRVPGEPHLYRTDFFQVGGTGSGRKSGDILRVTVDQRLLIDKNKFQFVSSPLRKVVLSTTPGSDKAGRLAGLWNEALVRAAPAEALNRPPARDEPFRVPDLKAVAGMPSGSVDGIDLTVGDHAAMLLLRDNFVAMMETQLAWLDSLTGVADVRKFREWVRPFVMYERRPSVDLPQWDSNYATYRLTWALPFGLSREYRFHVGIISDANKDAALKVVNDLDQQISLMTQLFKALPEAILNGGAAPPAPRSAFARIQVTGLDGAPTTLYDTFVTESDASKNVDIDRLRQWQVDSAREALEKYREVVKASLDEAKEIKDSDRKELLKLTGVAFGAVITKLIPRLMRLEETQNPRALRWVPDNYARAAVLNLVTTALAAQAHEQYTDAQLQFVIMAASVALSVPAIVSESAAASIVSLAGAYVMWEANSLKEILGTHKGHADVEFEFGKAIVLGPEALAQAEARSQSWFQALLSITAQGVPVGLQAYFDTLPKIALEMWVFRGEQTFQRFGTGGAGAFKALAAEQQSQVMALVENAAARDAQVLPLSLEEDEALAKARQIANEAAAPGRAAALAPEAKTIPPAAALKFREAKTGQILNEIKDAEQIQDLPLVQDPAKDSRVLVKSPNGDQYVVLGDFLGGGASAGAYEPLEIGGRKMGGDVVIKFVRDDVDKFGIVKLREEGGFGTAIEQIERMSNAQDALKATLNGPKPIEFAEILEFHPEASPAYVIQKKIKPDGVNTVMVKVKDLLEQVEVSPSPGVKGKLAWRPLPYDKLTKLFPVEYQRALPRLFRALADNGLKSTDLSLANLYFKRVGDEWVCGILDVDHVINVNQSLDNVTTGWIKSIEDLPWIKSRRVDGRALAQPTDFMEKMLEFERYGGNFANPYIRFNPATKKYEPVFVHPDMVKEFFPDFKSNLAPEVATPAVPQKHGSLFSPWHVGDASMDRATPLRFANDNGAMRAFVPPASRIAA